MQNINNYANLPGSTNIVGSNIEDLLRKILGPVDNAGEAMDGEAGSANDAQDVGCGDCIGGVFRDARVGSFVEDWTDVDGRESVRFFLKLRLLRLELSFRVGNGGFTFGSTFPTSLGAVGANAP